MKKLLSLLLVAQFVLFMPAQSHAYRDHYRHDHYRPNNCGFNCAFKQFLGVATAAFLVGLVLSQTDQRLYVGGLNNCANNGGCNGIRMQDSDDVYDLQPESTFYDDDGEESISYWERPRGRSPVLRYAHVRGTRYVPFNPPRANWDHRRLHGYQQVPNWQALQARRNGAPAIAPARPGVPATGPGIKRPPPGVVPPANQRFPRHSDAGGAPGMT